MPRVKLFDQQEVLEKAMELFWKKGYHATSIQDLVQHLGINRGSLYDTYGGKEELFASAINHYRAINTVRLDDFLQSIESVREGFEQLFMATIEDNFKDYERKGCFVVNTTTELVPGEARWLSIVEENKETIEAIYLKHLQRGVDNGEISADKDLKSTAGLLFMFISGLQVVAKMSPSREELQKTVQTALAALD